MFVDGVIYFGCISLFLFGVLIGYVLRTIIKPKDDDKK